MPLNLSELQQHFITSTLTAENSEPLLEEITQGDDLAKEQQLQIYRNNVRLTLVDDLMAKFPVILKLVGSDFFKALAKEFIKAQPPQTGSMTHYGEAFGTFLETFEHVQDLPYLADVADLEWHYYHAQFSPTAPALSPEQLHSLPQNKRFSHSLNLQPSAVLLESAYPTVQIFSVNQEYAEEAEISLEDGPNYALITRPEEDVLLWQLTKGEFHFLLACQRGLTLAEAKQLAETTDSDFNFAETLIHHLSGKTFCTLTTLKGDKPCA